jgi:CBS domain-containing protein
MRAHQIMTRKVISVKPGTSISDAANTMLQQHISGLPVLNGSATWSASSREVILFAARKSEPSGNAAGG